MAVPLGNKGNNHIVSHASKKSLLGRVPTIRIVQISSGFFARQGGNPQEYRAHFKDYQHSLAENPPKDGS